MVLNQPQVLVHSGAAAPQPLGEVGLGKLQTIQQDLLEQVLVFLVSQPLQILVVGLLVVVLVYSAISLQPDLGLCKVSRLKFLILSS